MRKYKIAIIGSGSLGSIIGEYVSQELHQKYEVLGVVSEGTENAKMLVAKIGGKAYNSIDQVIADKPDYIVEAATLEVLKEIAVNILENGISLIPLSVVALADKIFYNNIKEAAIEYNSRVHVPPGAVGDYHVLGSSMLKENAEACITTEKSPNS